MKIYQAMHAYTCNMGEDMCLSNDNYNTIPSHTTQVIQKSCVKIFHNCIMYGCHSSVHVLYNVRFHLPVFKIDRKKEAGSGHGENIAIQLQCRRCRWRVWIWSREGTWEI